MKVKLINCSPDAENHIVEIARVSSKRTDKKADPEGLLNYLITHNHWSPFEHAYFTVEIQTSKAIAIQLLRHRSFTFQEFSQRYSDVSILEGDNTNLHNWPEKFEPIELRRQAKSNRQSSTDIIKKGWSNGKVTGVHGQIEKFLLDADWLYHSLMKQGVARECARMILPLATKTKIHMTGSVRSWIHFLNIRDDSHAQKEIQLIAKEVKNILTPKLPTISKKLNW